MPWRTVLTTSWRFVPIRDDELHFVMPRLPTPTFG
jgi:hypothetical protein